MSDPAYERLASRFTLNSGTSALVSTQIVNSVRRRMSATTGPVGRLFVDESTRAPLGRFVDRTPLGKVARARRRCQCADCASIAGEAAADGRPSILMSEDTVGRSADARRG